MSFLNDITRFAQSSTKKLNELIMEMNLMRFVHFQMEKYF